MRSPDGSGTCAIYADAMDLPSARRSKRLAVLGGRAVLCCGARRLAADRDRAGCRIELAVRERTAALTEQVKEREQAEAAMRPASNAFATSSQRADRRVLHGPARQREADQSRALRIGRIQRR